VAGEVLGEIWAVAAGAGPVDVRVFIRGINNYPYRLTNEPKQIVPAGVPLANLVIQNLGAIAIEIGNDRSLEYGRGMRIPANSILSNGAITPGGATLLAVEVFTKASMPAPGNAGRVIMLSDYNRGLWLDTGTLFVSLDGEIFNIKNFGAVADSGVTDNGPAIRACITAAMAAAPGARIFAPRGDGYYGFTGGLSVNGAIGLSIIGEGGISNGAPVATQLRATDAPARVLDARNTEGFVLEDCSVLCANPAFAGTVVDLGSANHFTLYRDQVLHTAAGIFVDLSNTILGEIDDCSFNGAAITGASTGILLGGANITTIRLRDCNFKCAGNFTAIRATVTGEIDATVLDGITLDGIGNANPAVALIDFSTAALVRGLDISGVWTGDMGAGSTGGLIHAGLVRGLKVTGSFLAGSAAAAQTGITTLANSDGVEISGNELLQLATGLVIFTPVTNIDVTRNRNTATAPIAGYVPGGVIASPAVPASGVNATNNTGGYVTVHILANGAGAITAVTISASATGLACAAGGIITCRVGPGQTISITYPGAAPTWTWFRD
jgi:hypothetical protein